MNVFEHFPVLDRTVEDVFAVNELRTKVASGRRLRIKYGVDVTAPFLHLGHAVNLWAMRELQEAGHKVVLLLGDYTTRIGDPTGKSKTRPTLTMEQINRNADGFIEQVSQILLTNDDVFEVRRNSEWWTKMPLDRFLELLSFTTHARLISRDMFRKRIADSSDIHMHELVYPVLQGYDSYALEADLTIVGSDQLFNEMMGRFFQDKFGQEAQVVITTKITPGIDGGEKQSKSLGNYIAISDSARDKFGKAMSIPDHLVTQYLCVYTLIPVADIEAFEHDISLGRSNPMAAKLALARALVQRYHGEAAATEEGRWFNEVFSKRSAPTEVPTIVIGSEDATLMEILKACLPGESSSALRRLIDQGGVHVDGRPTDAKAAVTFVVKDGAIIKIGKRRWFRITFLDSPA